MSVIVIILFAIFAVAIFFVQSEIHKNSINNQVESIGGVVICIERTMFNNGPFYIKGKGRSIYKFTYNIGDETEEGWVRFGNLFGPDWRL